MSSCIHQLKQPRLGNPFAMAGVTMTVIAASGPIAIEAARIINSQSKSPAKPKPKFLTHADINLAAEQLDELCQPHLLVNAPYDAHEKIPDLHGCVTYQDKKWVILAAQMSEKETVYFIRPLEPVPATREAREPPESDSYFGRLVRLDGFVFEIESQQRELHVKVQKQDDGLVPLNEAMGAKPKNKKGRNRRK